MVDPGSSTTKLQENFKSPWFNKMVWLVDPGECQYESAGSGLGFCL